eukprot:CAMPEP_0204108486 /NCGR_PEP_ID=MMETSP0361-20130328/736_1 /ASSEMBLY_ACC=CAM_ASM_000343 /TAXON_ID=268821 /ORGANISM="Scrippsiella Hangoei, Strain SHTV-5" /LENGTH=75 /DNA_ID=CAMNT_0051058107 /DNA_START=20 /DNA_END=248 /DNA_ORIENTATION=-
MRPVEKHEALWALANVGNMVLQHNVNASTASMQAAAACQVGSLCWNVAYETQAHAKVVALVIGEEGLDALLPKVR